MGVAAEAMPRSKILERYDREGSAKSWEPVLSSPCSPALPCICTAQISLFLFFLVCRQLYAFGSGDYGRLGHGDNQPRKTAKLVEILRDKNVVRFACGPRHTLALTGDGHVYSWGYGGDGQLGHGDYQLQTMPAQIKRLQDQHVVDISCGEKHSCVVTSGGDVYTGQWMDDGGTLQ